MMKWAKKYYESIWQEISTDEDVDSWPLMANAWPAFGIVTLYLYFVLKLGPGFMKNRKAYELKKIMLVYNLSMVLYNGYMFLMVNTLFKRAPTIYFPWTYLCDSSNRKESQILHKTLHKCVWYFAISKFVELLDTVFFVLRKKQSQVSILHIYHHTNMAISTWLYLKYLRGEQSVVIGIINTLIHTLMYSYYFLTAALGPEERRKISPLKKYMTKLQLAQFCVILAYLVSLLAMDCKVQKALSVYMTLNTAVFFFLFLNFYVKAYKLSPKKRTEIGITKKL